MEDGGIDRDGAGGAMNCGVIMWRGGSIGPGIAVASVTIREDVASSRVEYVLVEALKRFLYSRERKCQIDT